MIQKLLILALALFLSGCTTIAVGGKLSAYDDQNRLQESWRVDAFIVLDAPAYSPSFGQRGQQQIDYYEAWQ